MGSMVGLSVILENCKDLSAKTSPRVVSKGSMIKPPSPTNPSRNNVFSSNVSGFLERCFLCNTKLMPGKDIYMYKGDRGFCSVECRCRQIFMDEEESSSTAKSGCTREYNNCSLAAAATTNSSVPSSSSSSSSRRSGGANKGARNRANNNAFAAY